MFGKSNELFGVDIGSSSIKLVYLKPKKKKGKTIFELESIGQIPLPREAIVEGSMMDSYAVSDALMQLVSEAQTKIKNVSISVSGNAVITKRMSISAATPEELEENIKWEIKNNTTFSPDDVQMDYFVLPSEGNYMEVLLVMAKKEKVGEYTGVVQQAGLNPVVVDIDAFSMYNSFEYNYEPFISNTVAIVHIGASLTSIVIAKNGAPVFIREKDLGGDFLTETIQKEFGFSAEKSEAVKKGETSEGITKGALKGIMEMVFNDISSELSKTIEFFSGQFSDTALDRIYLSGGGSLMDGLPDFVENKFNLPVEYLNPFRNVIYNEKAFSSGDLEKNAPIFTVATGLAMRTLGG